MKTVRLKNKEFAVSIDEEHIQRRVRQVADKINRDLSGETPIFLVVLNGAFVFAADLLRQISFQGEVCFVKLSSYEGTASTGVVHEVLGLTVDITNRVVVVVEDIIDSGLTMQTLLGLLQKHNPRELRIATLLVKPKRLTVNINIAYCCFEIPDDFIVGYGLDYDGFGRNLSEIYTEINDTKVKEE